MFSSALTCDRISFAVVSGSSRLVALPPDARLCTNRRQQAEVPALVAGHAAGQDEGVLLGVVLDERVDALDVLVRQRPLALHPPTRLLAPRSDAVLPVPLLNGTKLVPADSENRPSTRA